MLLVAIQMLERKLQSTKEERNNRANTIKTSEDPMMGNDHFAAIVMDVLSERGYHVSLDRRIHHVPVRIDLKTGKIELDTHHIYLLTVEYPKHYIRPLEQKFN